MSLSGLQFKMRQRIVNKLKKAGATSKGRAVTIKEAELDLREQLWLPYFAGAFMGEVKKTKDKRYYTRTGTTMQGEG